MGMSSHRRGGMWRPAAWIAAGVLMVSYTAAASEMTAPIEQLDAGLLQVMKAGKSTPFRQRYDLLAPLVTRAIDLDAILEGAVSANWGTLASDQQAALRAAFQRYSIATYVANFDDFGGERFELSAPVASGDPVVKVRIIAAKPGDTTHVLTYTMRQTPSGWKAVDVKADGTISQVVAQQEEIRAIVKSSGTGGLYARLQQKTAELSGGTVK